MCVLCVFVCDTGGVILCVCVCVCVLPCECARFCLSVCLSLSLHIFVFVFFGSVHVILLCSVNAFVHCRSLAADSQYLHLSLI